MEKPSQSDLIALGISQPYASLILGGHRRPAKGLAIKIYRELGWRHSCIDGFTDDELDVIARAESAQ